MKKCRQIYLPLAAIFLLCISFMPGGDVYEIYAGKERLVRNFVHSEKTTPVVKLTQLAGDDAMSVFYNHCGKLGIGRTITLKTGDFRISKTWKFADGDLTANVTGGSKYMKINTSEIVQMKKQTGKSRLGIYYSSREIPEGRLLAFIE